MPAASYILLPKREKALRFPTGERSTICAVCFAPTARGQVVLYQTPGRRPSRITGRVVKTASREWVGTPDERPPFIIHNAVIGFVDRCLSSTQSRRLDFVFPDVENE